MKRLRIVATRALLRVLLSAVVLSLCLPGQDASAPEPRIRFRIVATAGLARTLQYVLCNIIQMVCSSNFSNR